jgi:Uma2 family endonuclease
MEVLEQIAIPKTWAEREALALEVLQVPATLDEFFEWAEECEYRIEYYNGEIISFMSQASVVHETLVAYLSHLLYLHYDEKEDYSVMSSNIKIFSDECQTAFNADLTVIKGEPEYFTLPSNRLSKATIKNPEIIVEILSDSTRNFDFGAKLNCYKTIPSLKQIIFIDQAKVYISSYIRTSDPHEWINHDYYSITESLKFNDFQLKLKDIYRKTNI